MQKEAEKIVRSYRAFTLVEVILVAGMIALVAGSLIGLVGNSYKDFKLGSDRSTLLQDGRSAIEQMVRILRQARAFGEVTESNDQAGRITFTDVDGTIKQFELNTQTDEIEYGQPDSLSALTDAVSSLVFTCYDINGDILTGSVPVRIIQSIQITATLADTENNLTLSGRVFCPTDFKSVVINEIMYNPPTGNDTASEWLEIYNLGASSIDLTGWTIWTNNQSTEDQLVSHPQFGNGSTMLPANGYAVISTEGTAVYTELITNGNFESKLKSPWRVNGWSRTKWNSHNGSYKLESGATGSAWAYQDITVPSGYNSCLFLFWESTNTPVDQTQMTVTIRNQNDQVLDTGYNGQMNSAWTCHIMDLTTYAGQDIRIYFSTNKAVDQGVLLLDDTSVATSNVDISAVRLSVDDNNIGNGLGNNNDTVAITDGIATVDSVSYDSSWGGDGDGTSLERINPQEPSNSQDNWTSGPINGTPGSAN